MALEGRVKLRYLAVKYKTRQGILLAEHVLLIRTRDVLLPLNDADDLEVEFQN